VPAADLIPLAREYRGRVLDQLGSPPQAPDPLWGDQRPACGTCTWSDHCAEGRRAADDLSLVAGMRRDQVHRLRDNGVRTVNELADATVPPIGMGEDTWTRLQHQAALQVAGTGKSPPVFEVIDPAALTALPAPDPGDLYYDIEGDPFAEAGSGLEYLHGFVDPTETFTAHWAHDRAAEKIAFERVVDTITTTARAHPGMHVYHYAPYERTALTTLAARHATREEEVDQLLRDGRLVDLYAAVRRSVRVSTESYSIKKLEPLYMGDDIREGEVTTASDSIVEYERAVVLREAGEELEGDEILAALANYNAYDCVSTHRLHQWLLSLRGPASTPPLPPEPKAVREPATELVADELRATVPDHDRTPDEQAVALLAAAIGYHRRNTKTFWWEHFDRLRRPLAELADADAVVLLDRPTATGWEKPTPRSRSVARTVTAATTSTPEAVRDLRAEPVLIYGAPVPDHLTPTADSDRAWSTAVEAKVASGGVVEVIERAPKGNNGWTQMPIALAKGPGPQIAALEAVLTQLGDEVLGGGGRDTAWFRLLCTEPPRSPLPRSGDDFSDITAAVRALQDGVLAVQGPPGTGKTHVGSHVIAALARTGWRIGVTAQSHTTIANLLRKVTELGVTVAKKPRGGDEPWETPTNLGTWMGKQEGGYVVGGTAWTFAAGSVREHALDLIVVDEAGQFSLPDAVVAGSTAPRILLLGDPQQLAQVAPGVHPEPVDVSALAHVLGDRALVPPSHGYLLTTTWRMHPALCAPVSALQYEGTLHSDPSCSQRHLDGVTPGVLLVPIAHEDRRTQSPEEVEAVIALVSNLIGRSWTDVESTARPLGAWVSYHELSVCHARGGACGRENCVHGIDDGPGSAV